MGPLDYGSVAYKKFILARTRAIGEILHAGYAVLLADVDAVWFSDPFVHMKVPSAFHASINQFTSTKSAL